MNHRLCTRLLLITFAAIFVLSGCVYYNTFYNARKSFNRAEKSRKQTGQGSQADYKAAIDKSLKVVEDHANSSYYDDALYVLGVSYFFTNEPLKADHRFRELLANYPNSKYSKPATVYLAKTKLKLDEVDDAIHLFEQIFEEKFDRENKADAAIELATYYLDRKEYADAERYLLATRDSLGTEEQKLTAQRMIADMYFDDYKFGSALDAYQQILSLKPGKWDKYHAIFQSAVCSYRLQRITAGLDYLDQLAKDPLYYDSLGAVQLSMGEGREWAGDLPLAADVYENVAIQKQNPAWVGEANYRLGLMYQYDYDDLAKAREYYEKAGQGTGENATDARQRAADIGTLQSVTKAQQDAEKVRAKKAKDKPVQTATLDTTQAIGADTSKALDSIFVTVDTLAPAGDTAVKKDTSAPVLDTSKMAVATDTVVAKDTSRPVDSLTRPDTIVSADSTAAKKDTLTAAAKPTPQNPTNLANANPAMRDSLARMYDSLRANDTFFARVLAPRDSANAPFDPLALRHGLQDSLAKGTVARDTLTRSDSSKMTPSTPASAPAMGQTAPSGKQGAKSKALSVRDSIAAARRAEENARLQEINASADNFFKLGQLYWFQINKPDSAIWEMEQLTENYPEADVAPRAAIILAQMYREQRNDTAKADSVLRSALVRYAHTDDAPDLIEQLGLKGTPADTGYAKIYFDKAEAFLFDSIKTDSIRSVDSALAYYQYVADHFPKSSYYLQARFNMVWARETYRSPGDSSIVFAYRAITDSFPGSAQAAEASRRLTYRPPVVRQPEADTGRTARRGSVPDTNQDNPGVLTARSVGVGDTATIMTNPNDPQEKAFVGPKGEHLFLLDIKPIETRVEFEYPPEAGRIDQSFWLYFQILLDFSGRVKDVTLKVRSANEVLNDKATKTVMSMQFDPLEVNRETTRKAENLTLPEDQADPRGRWYVYKFLVEKPDWMN